MTSNLALNLENNLLALKTLDLENNLRLEIPKGTDFKSLLQSAILSEDFDRNSIIRNISGVVTCVRPIKTSDFRPATITALDDFIQRKRLLTKKSRKISIILSLLYLLGMGITYFAIGEWTFGVAFLGACLVLIKALYFLCNLWTRRYRISPISFFIVGGLALVGISILLGFEIAKKVSERTDELNSLSSSLDVVKQLIGNVIQCVVSLKNGTNLNSHEVQEKVSEIMNDADIILKMSNVMTASIKELSEALSLKKRICELINEISSLAFPFIEFVFGIRIAW